MVVHAAGDLIKAGAQLHPPDQVVEVMGGDRLSQPVQRPGQQPDAAAVAALKIDGGQAGEQIAGAFGVRQQEAHHGLLGGEVLGGAFMVQLEEELVGIVEGIGHRISVLFYTS